MAALSSGNGALVVSHIIHCNSKLEQFAVVQYFCNDISNSHEAYPNTS